MDRLGGCLKRRHLLVVAERTNKLCCPHHTFPSRTTILFLACSKGPFGQENQILLSPENKSVFVFFLQPKHTDSILPFGIHAPRVARFVVAKTTPRGKRLEHRPEHRHAPKQADPEGHDRGLLHPPASIEHILGVPQGSAAQQGQDRLLRWQELHRQVLRQLG